MVESREKLVDQETGASELGPAAFVRSELFGRTFREGMQLVEETANYLDGDGRKASSDLSREAALSYASASMRLTTQLMQIASWLLVLRAVREGDMTLQEAADPKYRLTKAENNAEQAVVEGLPSNLVQLIELSDQLFSRIFRLDTDLFISPARDDAAAPRTDAAGQQRALLQAFGRNS